MKNRNSVSCLVTAISSQWSKVSRSLHPKRSLDPQSSEVASTTLFDAAELLDFESLQHRISLLPQELQDEILIHVIRARLSVGKIWLMPCDRRSTRFELHRSLVDTTIYRALNRKWLGKARDLFYRENTFLLGWRYGTMAYYWQSEHAAMSDENPILDGTGTRVREVELQMGQKNSGFRISPRPFAAKLHVWIKERYTRPELNIARLFPSVGLKLGSSYFELGQMLTILAIGHGIRQICVLRFWPEQDIMEMEGGTADNADEIRKEGELKGLGGD